MRAHPLKRMAARTAAAAMVAGGLILGFAGIPALAATPPGGTYTVLGDSYSAGSGGGMEAGPCLQSPNGYGSDFAAANGLSMTNLACYGATISQVSALQVPLVPPTTRLVTLTVGANDVGAGQVAAACLLGTPETCQGAIAGAQAKLALLPGQVSALTQTIRAQVPQAQVLFMGYPHLLEPANMAALGYPPAEVAAAVAVNAAVDQLNAVLAQSVQRSGAGFVPVAGLFDGHGFPSPDSWLVSPFVSLPLAFHPTAEGYASGYAAALQGVQLSPPLYAEVWR
ncbi:SGNH/GDSL hydrolase family protein [Arthrobacter sp. STN4]|uniref:SGNH/GDSL hydrolase family protein n=1 Tax=Arthrobacter sp. STN4 TaxID=2923276 RepID=UPI002119E418|nr:SGNH/GDSL hydrolase family protein [Arthrobacter sp. STN4]MCQ9163898.1 SGNH/GDSL hydrolase family protein [Arthrobacter sp. STN4]